MLNKLRQHLAGISAQQFQAEWAEIEAMGFEGITVEEFLKTLRLTPTIAQIKTDNPFASAVNDEYEANPVVNYSFAMAA
jgi:hypothetical protein